MLATKARIGGHYEVRETALATDYVWVGGEEEVERHLLEEILHPWRANYAEWIKDARAHPELQEQMELGSLQ